MCFAFLAGCSVRPSVRRHFAVCHKMRPYRRDALAANLPKNFKFKNHSLVRFFADKYDETVTDYTEKYRKARVAEKVVCELYFMLVVVPDEFDFSVCRLGASYLILDTSS